MENNLVASPTGRSTLIILAGRGRDLAGAHYVMHFLTRRVYYTALFSQQLLLNRVKKLTKNNNNKIQ